MDRTIRAWLAWEVRKAFPDGIIPEELSLGEGSMLAEKLAKYFEEARQEGLREGRREGKEGQVQSLRKVLLQQMTLRFGRLPKDVRSQVERITSTQELETLARKVVTVKSLQEMGFG